jgi:hypothetical protein
LEFSLLSGPARDQPDPPNGLHLQPNVFRLHEREGKQKYFILNSFVYMFMLIIHKLFLIADFRNLPYRT